MSADKKKEAKLRAFSRRAPDRTEPPLVKIPTIANEINRRDGRRVHATLPHRRWRVGAGFLRSKPSVFTRKPRRNRCAPGKTQNVMTEAHVGRILDTYDDHAELRGRMKGYLKELCVDA